MKRSEIIERIDGCLDEMFRDFQGDNDIESGDLCPELTDKLDLAMHGLADVIQMCMTWQKDNCPRASYEQTYAPDTDTTFIMKNVYVWGDLVSREVTGFYSGKPSAANYINYRDHGTKAEY